LEYPYSSYYAKFADSIKPFVVFHNDVLGRRDGLRISGSGGGGGLASPAMAGERTLLASGRT